MKFSSMINVQPDMPLIPNVCTELCNEMHTIQKNPISFTTKLLSCLILKQSSTMSNNASSKDNTLIIKNLKKDEKKGNKKKFNIEVAQQGSA